MLNNFPFIYNRFYRRQPTFKSAWATSKRRLDARLEVQGLPHGSIRGRRRAQRRALARGCEGDGCGSHGTEGVREEWSLLHSWKESSLLLQSRLG